MDAERTYRNAVGYLVILGFFGVLPVFFIGWFFGLEMISDMHSLIGSIRWSGPASIWQVFLQMIRYGSRGEAWSRLLLFFAAVYLVLLWQWVIAWCGWRTLVSERRLWAVSSGYFLAAILFFAGACYQAFGQNGAHVEDSAEANRWSWLLATIALSTFPTAYLCVTVPLWVMTRPVKGRGEQFSA